MIPFLPSSAWLEFRGRPANPGLNLTTHQALISAPNGQVHKCYVKASPLSLPTVFTEAVGWLVADALNLPRPKFAALLMLPVNKLRQCMPLDQHWLAHSEIPAFCSSAVDGKSISGRWQWFTQLKIASAFKHSDIPRIAAFDTWVENQDRHMGNVLRTADGGYVPIDNEAILYSLIWASTGVSFAHNSLKLQAHAILKQSAYSQFESSMILASHQHENAFQKAWPSLQQLIQAMVPDSLQASQLCANMNQFLSTRASQHWLSTELGHIG